MTVIREPAALSPPPGVLDRALLVLEVFEAQAAPLTLMDLVAETGMAKSTVHRMLQSLVSWGVLERSGIHYRLGMRLFELGQKVRHQEELREAALPFLADLYEGTHEIVHLGVLRGTDVVYLERLSGHQSVACPSRVGGRMPAHCTAVGKVLLAEQKSRLREALQRCAVEGRTPYSIRDPFVLREQLEVVRKEGVAYDREEARLGLCCVAAPVRRAGHTIAGLSVSCPTSRPISFALTAKVRAVAQSLSAALSSTT